MCFSKGITSQLEEVQELYPGPTHPHRSPPAHPWQGGVLWGKMKPVYNQSLCISFYFPVFAVFVVCRKCENVISSRDSHFTVFNLHLQNVYVSQEKHSI